MFRLLCLTCFSLLTLTTMAGTIVVKNMTELNEANKKAQPGDIIILQNGEWKDVIIKLSCTGTKEKPVTFKAQNAGKVMITGHSQLKLGGSYIVVEGLLFTNGYAGDDAVIGFRINKDQLANNCRVTNCVIDDFNNAKRMEENNWVLFYGKNNRLDHCSFKDKKNMGVLLAVVLDDERSRENHHSIDHNYFGRRVPLASNGGEIIRVGVSQHCQFNSNTEISSNLFEECDGEAEIISIKSGSNVIQENIFKQCQGAVVLRHGDNNMVTSNIFLGNNKPGTGGVRVINKGQKVTHNVFYKCRGESFRSPLTIMNGIPNSPAHRYVQVTDAAITANTFYECSPLSLCEGSDTERTLPPDKVIFSKNIFYNSQDSALYKAWDDISGISFRDNKVSHTLSQQLPTGFEKEVLPEVQFEQKISPAHEATFGNIVFIHVLEKQATQLCGASWYPKKTAPPKTYPQLVNCQTTEQLYKQLEKKNNVTIRLTGKEYWLNRPIVISKGVTFIGDKKTPVTIRTTGMNAAFVIIGKGYLVLQDLVINGSGVSATHFITSDSSGPVEHYNLVIRNCVFRGLDRKNGCHNFLYGYKYMLADSIVIRNNLFENNRCNFLVMAEEKENKGYYNAEKITIRHNHFKSQNGSLLDIYRGGNDESTLGPQLLFSHNKITSCSTIDNSPLIQFTGVQLTNVFSNQFTDCNAANILVSYKDIVRAKHIFEKNVLATSGTLTKNNFVTEKDTTIK